MARATPVPFRAVVRSKSGMRLEISGDIKTGLIHSFYMVDGAEARKVILREMQKVHDEMNAKELARANASAPA